MAQFQIIDKFDVEVCKLPYEKALSFCDYLNSIGIKAKAKEGYSGFYIIFVTNESDKLKAKLELVRHSDSAFCKEFEKVSWKSGKTVSSKKRLNSNSLPFTYNLFSVVSIIQIHSLLIPLTTRTNIPLRVAYIDTLITELAAAHLISEKFTQKRYKDLAINWYLFGGNSCISDDVWEFGSSWITSEALFKLALNGTFEQVVEKICKNER